MCLNEYLNMFDCPRIDQRNIITYLDWGKATNTNTNIFKWPFYSKIQIFEYLWSSLHNCSGKCADYSELCNIHFITNSMFSGKKDSRSKVEVKNMNIIHSSFQTD